VCLDFGSKVSDIFGQLGQRCLIAQGKLADAPGQILRDAVKFALDASREFGEPFVVDNERLDVIFRERGILGVELPLQLLLHGFEGDVSFLV